jgi:hypothetical protein
MRRLLMILLGLMVIACFTRRWVWPLIEGQRLRHDVQDRMERMWKDWSQGDRGL